jgi:membrane-associated phospholipid phosphatase
MPSLHVAIVTLCAISGWYLSRLVGALLTLFAIVIFIGSIHLGWHYALDGYASALMAGGIWYGVGKFLGRSQTAAVTRFADRPQVQTSQP